MSNKDRVSFQIDRETREAFRELKSKYGLNISAFLRSCLVGKHKELKTMETSIHDCLARRKKSETNKVQ